MYKLILLLGICSAFSFSSSEPVSCKKSEKIIGCYFENFAIFRESKGKFGISNIDASLCTHVIYTFGGTLDKGIVQISDPSLDPQNNGFKRFDEFRKNNPSVKTLISMAGWTQGSSNYTQTVSNPTLRGKVVENLVKLVLKYKFNGFDLDWEYPAQRGGVPSDRKNFISLLKEIRRKFDKHGLILCVSAGATEETAKISYNIKKVSQYAHIIHLMTYQFHAPYDYKPKIVGHNTPLYPSSKENAEDKKLNIQYIVRYWLKHGAAPKKILLGIALSGNSYTLSSPVKTVGRGAPFVGPGEAGKYTHEYGTLGYNEICDLIQNQKWKVVYDKEQQVPYTYNKNQIVAYDNVESLTKKAEFIKKHNLGGAMMWSIDTDDFSGQCGEKYPLLKTVNCILRNKKLDFCRSL